MALTARVPSSAMLSERAMLAPTPMHSTQSCSMTCSVWTAGKGQLMSTCLVAAYHCTILTHCVFKMTMFCVELYS